MIAPHEIESRCVGKTLQEATKLLGEVGYKIREGKAVDDRRLLQIVPDFKRVNVILENGKIKTWVIG